MTDKATFQTRLFLIIAKTNLTRLLIKQTKLSDFFRRKKRKFQNMRDASRSHFVALKSYNVKLYLYIKLSCHFPFQHAENACVLRTIGIYLQAVWANPRFISSNQGKNATLCVAISLGIFLFKIENACVKNLKRDVTTSLKVHVTDDKN